MRKRKTKKKSLHKFIDEHFKGKRFTAKQLVDAARPKDSPAHRFFEWDDRIAGERFRVHQATVYIANIKVRAANGGRVREYFNVKVGSRRYYMDEQSVKDEGDLWEQVVQDALTELKGWSLRYEAYKEFSPIRKAIKQVERKVKNVR